nr:hypothetical protein [Allocatelliglobosispora scoriae]
MSVTDFSEHVGAARRTVVKWSTRGTQVTLRPDMQAAMDTVLSRASAEVAERFERLLAADTSGTKATVIADPKLVDTERTGLCTFDLEGDVRRRNLLPFAVTAMAQAMAAPSVISLLDAMVPTHEVDDATPWTVAELRQAVASAKVSYQACHYERVVSLLTPLLAAVSSAEARAGADDLREVRVLAAEAYHVTGSVLLKRGDPPLALLAAERSVRYARASGDPIAVAGSARVMAHALMSNKHSLRAIEVVESAAQALDRSSGLGTRDAAATYGALALMGAVGAARNEDRDTAHTLLGEASRAAARFGHDGNDRWTGFGPTNVLLHRVEVALSLGDAGTAIALARQVELDRVTLAERKVSLFTNVAQAYTQWGRYEQALSALHTADRIAPEEIRSRPAVRRTVTDLAARTRGHIRAEVDAFAAAAGMAL